MRPEVEKNSPIQLGLKNGDIINQHQFTQLLLEQEGIASLDLLTMAYMTSRGNDGGSVQKIHNHLLKLAKQGTQIYISSDYNYTHLIAPHSDFPNILAPFFMDRNDLRQENLKRKKLYHDLDSEPNVDIKFNGRRKFRIFPHLEHDHRKILRIKGSSIQDFAVIYGFNMDDTLDHDVDSGIYITDPKALAWIDKQKEKTEKAKPEKVTVDNFSFVTREVSRRGNQLAEQEIKDVIQHAHKTLLVSGQYLPDGKIMQEIIKAADRGVDINIISNMPAPSRQPLYMFTRMLAARRLNHIGKTYENVHFFVPNDPEGFIHTKAIIADINDPVEASALTGTDNMTNQMLKIFGTREVLVRLNNYSYIRNLYEYIEQYVMSSTKQIKFQS